MDTQNMNNENTHYQDNTSNVEPVSFDANAIPGQQPTPTLSIVGLVLGIISIVFCCGCGIGCIFGIAGIVCSVLGNKQTPSGVGTAGLICSIVGVVLGAIALFSGLLPVIFGSIGMQSYPVDNIQGYY